MINVETLRTLRTDRGFSIRALATTVGVDPRTIGRLERGADPGDLPIRVLGRIATALGVHASVLLAGTTAADSRPLEEQIGGIVHGTPNITITAVAASLAVPIEEVRQTVPRLKESLSASGLTLAQHGDALRITPAVPRASTAVNMQPMSVNEARLLRRIERGEDVRRCLSNADREFNLPALARRGLVDISSQVPGSTSIENRSPQALARAASFP